MKCPQCGSTDIDNDTSRGDAACMQCGFIMHQNTIVSEVGFAEGANGASSVIGQFVPSTGASRLSASAKGRGPGGRGPSVGYQKDSREHTIANGRKHIQAVADHLRLRVHHVDSAVRLFMLAVQHNFIQGRRTAHVVAACLYIVCRREKTPHLLIDFSDVLQINLYVLGATFLKFIRLLNLSLPIIDPSLYIHRFAAQLELRDDSNQDKTHVVAMTALRLVARMKRDWILVGRRPSGICGACLLIASRIHGFKRTQKEIIYIVKICDMTLRKRLTEFSNTQSSQLTLEAFEQMDVELITNSKKLIEAENEEILKREGPNAQLKPDPFGLEQDPPAFTRNRVAEKEAQQIIQSKERLRNKKEEMLKELELDAPTKDERKQRLLQPGEAEAAGASSSSASNLHPPQLVPPADPDSRDLEIQAIQKQTRQLIDSNPQVSDSLVQQIQEMMEGKQSEFSTLDEGPQRQLTTNEDTRVHVTPLHSFDPTTAAVSTAAAAASSSSSSILPPGLAQPSKERLKSIHKGPNLHAATSRHRARTSTPATSIFQSKDAPQSDLSSLFAPSAASHATTDIASFHHVGKPFADALAVANDPSIMNSAPDTALTVTGAPPSTELVDPSLDTNLANWTDLNDFDEEISESILLSPEETAWKTKAWEDLNKDYLKEQEDKKALALAQGTVTLGPDGQPLPKRSYKKKTKSGPASSAAEAAMRKLAEKKFSANVNYKNLQAFLAKLDDDAPSKQEKKTEPSMEDVAEDDEEEEEEDGEDTSNNHHKKRVASSLESELPSAKRQIRSITRDNDGDDEDAAGEEHDDDEEMSEHRTRLPSAMDDDDDHVVHAGGDDEDDGGGGYDD